MAVSEEEKRIAKAYSTGYTLSIYAPRVIDNLIKNNPKNDFVRIMAIARNHHHFNVNMPRKDQSREYKTGFHNGRMMAEYSPEMFDRMLTSKHYHKDFKRGLEDARFEYKVLDIQKRMKAEPQKPSHQLRNDETFTKGFNIGYRLAEGYGVALNHADRMSEKYAKFTEGLKAGKQQYEFDFKELKSKNPNARMFPDDPKTSHYIRALTEHKLAELNDISERQLKAIERSDTFQDVKAPKWLEKKDDNKSNDKTKIKNKNKNIERD